MRRQVDRAVAEAGEQARRSEVAMMSQIREAQATVVGSARRKEELNEAGMRTLRQDLTTLAERFQEVEAVLGVEGTSDLGDIISSATPACSVLGRHGTDA